MAEHDVPKGEENVRDAKERLMNYQKLRPHIGLGTAIVVGLILCVGTWLTVAYKLIPGLSPLDTIQFIQTLMIIATGVFIFWQLRQSATQHKMDRLVAWKTSIQDISEAIVQKPNLFVPLLYGDIDRGEGEKLVATYACLHALETIYYMRKEEEIPPTELMEFLKLFVSASPAFETLWKNKAFRPAFTRDFQDQLNEILDTGVKYEENKDERGDVVSYTMKYDEERLGPAEKMLGTAEKVLGTMEKEEKGFSFTPYRKDGRLSPFTAATINNRCSYSVARPG